MKYYGVMCCLMDDSLEDLECEAEARDADKRMLGGKNASAKT